MRTVGTLLRQKRLAKELSLSQVEAATKIRQKLLEFIEADEFQKLPSATIARGLVKNYADFLGLDSRTTLAFLRRQMSTELKAHIVPRGMVEPLNRTIFQLTPGKFMALLVGGLVTIFLLYLGFQYRALQTPPRLIVESPEDSLVVREKRIDVTGTTDADATVTVNGVSVLVRRDGKFFDQVSLEPGTNNITLVATSRYGKSTTVVRKVLLTE